VGAAARTVARKLEELRKTGSLQAGVKMPGGGKLKVVAFDKEVLDKMPLELNPTKVDNQIVAFVYAQREKKNPPILVSKDINVRLKCDSLGVKCEDYLKLRAVDSESDLYTGVTVIETTHDIFETFSLERKLEDLDKLFPKQKFYPNQIAVLKYVTLEGTTRSFLTRYTNKKLVPLREIKEAAGMYPRNKEQRFALDLLFNNDIKLVTLVSKAGTGKTSLALAAGLAQLYGFGDDDCAKFTKLIVSRPVMPLGKDLGFLPGTLEEKMAPWVAPVKDALEFLLGDKKSKKQAAPKSQGNLASNTYLQMMQEKGMIEVEAITYIRGRSIPNAFIIIDEAQNLSIHELKTIVTRAGEGTKIVLTGDIQQIDNVHVDTYTNGLVYCVEKFKEHEIAAHISLIKGERSALASLSADIL
jgi:PhoH-like ATPase